MERRRRMSVGLSKSSSPCKIDSNVACRLWRFSFVATCLGVTATAEEASRGLPPQNLRVDFALHGSDWTEGSCGSRKSQSPVNLNDVARPAEDYFPYQYSRMSTAPFQFTLNNDGRVLSADVSAAGLGGLALPASSGGADWYPLVRIDFHAASEHTIKGQRAPLEVQLVHRAPTGTVGISGHELVTVSLLVDCDNPPMPPPPPPALQPGEQAGAASALQGATSAVTAALATSELQLRASGRRIARHRLNATSASRQVPVGYTIPSPGMPGFNAFLQPFVAQEPPVAADSLTVNAGGVGGGPDASSLFLNSMLESGTFWQYRGSETLPPCEERVVWLVRREPIRASDAQVAAIFARLYSTSNDAGNYRTIMPMNQRDVLVLESRAKSEVSTTTAAPMANPNDMAAALASAQASLSAAKTAEQKTKALADKVKIAVAAKVQKRADDALAAQAQANATRQAMAEHLAGAITAEVVPAVQNLARVLLKKGLMREAQQYPA